MAQPDPAYVPPKGAYDNPASFFRPLKAVGETYEHSLGAPLTNGYQRQVRLKLIGLENLSRLTTLKENIQQSDDAQQKRAASSSDGQGGLLGGLMGKLNPLMAKEAVRQAWTSPAAASWP